jgi:hypothetical protein
MESSQAATAEMMPLRPSSTGSLYRFKSRAAVDPQVLIPGLFLEVSAMRPDRCHANVGSYRPGTQPAATAVGRRARTPHTLRRSIAVWPPPRGASMQLRPRTRTDLGVATGGPDVAMEIGDPG